ncbi:MAG: GGDEF domain-containing protein [Gammaproteobacteria bacterium]
MATNNDKDPVKIEMVYSDSFDQAHEYLRTALPLINKHKVTPNPINYSVWYAYASGQNSKLTEAINKMISSKTVITDDVCHQLYNTHIQNHDLVAAQVHESVNKVMDALTDQLVTSTNKTEHFGQVLGSVDEELSNATLGDNLQSLVNNLSAETKIIQNVNYELTEELVNSSNELEQLKQDLEEAQRAANTDVLTGIPNRQAFSSSMELLISEQRPFCLLLADIDFFKNFNDTYGHQLGDKILRLVAQTLQKQLKGQDMVSRFGGEEFAVILPETPFTGALTVAENLRKTIQNQRLRRTDNKDYISSITLTIGVSKYRPGDNVQDIIERADVALYQGKSDGRNCVVSESDELIPA